MSFKDCIASAVEARGLSQDRADTAVAAFDEAMEQALVDGMNEGAASMHAATAAMESITKVNAERRWQKVKEMQVAHLLVQRFEGSKAPWDDLEAIMEMVELDYESMRGFAMANLDRLLLKYKPRALRPSRTDGLDDIVRAYHGDVRTPEAKEGAEALKATLEDLRRWANSHGATIPETENYLFQTHDGVKVDSVSRDTWVNDHLRDGVVAWDVMRYEGKEIPVGKRREVLEHMRDGIISDGALRPGYLLEGATPNLATRLNRDRFLHYASADSWLEMRGKYGSGNLFEQTIGMVDAMAKDISVLKNFGPSPDSMREFTKRLAEQRAAQIGNAKGGDQQKTLNRARRATALFDRMYDIHARHVTSADGNWAVQTISGIRTVAVGSKLGGVVIPSFFGDLANAKMMRSLTGMPQAGLMRQYFLEVANGNVATKDAIRLGVIFDNGIGLAHSRQRYFGALDGPHAARVFSDQVYRIGLASAHTQIARNAVGKQFLGYLADTRKVAFDDHPMAGSMLEVGITKEDWDTMREFPLTTVAGAEFLVPLDMLKTGTVAQRATAEKFGRLMQMMIRLQIPDTTLRSRAAMGEAIDPNSALGQFNRTWASLLSFPVALHFNQLRKISQLPRVRDKITFGAAYFLYLSMAGAMITQAKALISGQQLHDMSTVDFWGRSVINGGSMGILGDLIMNALNLNGSSYRAGDPTTELLKAVKRLTIDNLLDAAQGEKIEAVADVVKMSDQVLPKMWYMKLLFERELMDQITQEVDPAGFAASRRYEQEHEEGMWWGQGQAPEALRPETAVGG